MSLPIATDYPPMEADTAREIPAGPEWEYEPKWDGFRCLAFRDGEQVDIMSKSGQPLARYFPEIVAGLQALAARKFVIDGEIIVTENRTLDFDALLQRIHPAESRIRKLSKETPATLVVFDLLVDDKGKDLTGLYLRSADRNWSSSRKTSSRDRIASAYRREREISIPPRAGSSGWPGRWTE